MKPSMGKRSQVNSNKNNKNSKQNTSQTFDGSYSPCDDSGDDDLDLEIPIPHHPQHDDWASLSEGGRTFSFGSDFVERGDSFDPLPGDHPNRSEFLRQKQPSSDFVDEQEDDEEYDYKLRGSWITSDDSCSRSGLSTKERRQKQKQQARPGPSILDVSDDSEHTGILPSTGTFLDVKLQGVLDDRSSHQTHEQKRSALSYRDDLYRMSTKKFNNRAVQGNAPVESEEISTTDQSDVDDRNRSTSSEPLHVRALSLPPLDDADKLNVAECRSFLSKYSSSDEESIIYECDREPTENTKNNSHRDADDPFDDKLSTFVQSANHSRAFITGKFSFGSNKPPKPQQKPMSLMSSSAQENAKNFAIEHRIYLKSVMELLAERENFSIAVDIDDPNTLKAGPLKKATHLVKGAWRFKYVEIRRGTFSYYEDALSRESSVGSEGGRHLQRKNIKLSAENCVCRAVKLNHHSLTTTPGHATHIFELTVKGGPRRFWMAHSKEERSAWIRAINDAMIGGMHTTRGAHTDHRTRSGKVSKRSPYRKDLIRYLRTQKELKHATTKEAYVSSLSKLVGQVLTVPVQWISEENAVGAEDTKRTFSEQGVTVEVGQLWKDLARDTVEMNGDFFKGGSGHAVERIIGSLVRQIMSFDRSSTTRPENASWPYITEIQAISFARDILLSGNRTRSGGDSYYCVDALCKNSGLIVLTPSSLEAEPVSVSVDHTSCGSGKSPCDSYSSSERSGWLKTRLRTQREWRRRYFVLSDGTLTIYEQSQPRPHGVIGQIKITDISINVVQVSQSKRERRRRNSKRDLKTPTRLYLLLLKIDPLTERQILWDDVDKFILWAHALESAIAGKETADDEASHPRKGMFRMRGLRDDEHRERRKGFALAKNSLYDHCQLLGFSQAEFSARVAEVSLQHDTRPEPTVKVSVCASTVYNICTIDPQGDAHEDTWATIRATFNQSFSLTGGPNGRMMSGEEIVEVNVLKCSRSDAELQDQYRTPERVQSSPRTFGGRVGRRLRRASAAAAASPAARAVANNFAGGITIDVKGS